MTDLSRLSDHERRVLLLLAGGHTAKSIATELGISPNAVNERLRDARRKTGLGSSRELARVVRAAEAGRQESCHNNFGVATLRAATPIPPHLPDRSTATGIPRSLFAMTILAAGVGALVAAIVAGALASHASAAPHVVSTTPRIDAHVAPGPLTLEVTFDQPMRAGSYSFVMRNPQTFPDCAKAPTQSYDGRTFKLSCVVQADRRYEVGFNAPRFRGFAAAGDGKAAVPSLLTFSTRPAH